MDFKKLDTVAEYYSTEGSAYKRAEELAKEGKGKEKQRYDTDHAKELRQYTEKRQTLLAHLDGEKIMPKPWKAELAEIEKVLPDINQRWGDDVINLSMGEIIEHNREKVERAERYERTPREPERSTQEQRKKRSEPSL